MKPSVKIWVIAIVGICVVFYQYHLSSGIRMNQMSILNSEASGDTADTIGNFGISRITEEMIKAAVDVVREANGLSPDIGRQLTQELLSQLVKPDAALMNNVRIDRSAGFPVKAPATSTVASCSPAPTVKKKQHVETLYIITPTYRRPEQIPELTRMSHTLMLIENIHWLVIEDAKERTKQVTELLERTGLKFDHLVAPMPEQYKLKKGAKPRGVSNRNRGLQWLRANATKGIFYFADDDNTYDITLFDELRKTKRVSMFPVGLCTKFGLSTPVVRNGTFVGFYDGWVAGRKFPVDMAGFAVSVEFLHQRPNASMPFKPGYEEDGFLKSLAPLEPKEVELLADTCTRVLAWHTQTKKNEPSAALNMKQYNSTNLVELKRQIV